MLSGVASAMKGLFFPQEQGCPICGRRGSQRHICQICLEEWAELADGLIPCAKCGRFKKAEGGETSCQECREHEPLYAIARCVAPYEDSVRDVLHSFKFSGRRELAYPLGELMASLVASLFPYRLLAAVIPVPLHENRLQERGFNQALLLAGVVSKMLRIPLVPNALIRSRETHSQTSLSREQRQSNLKGAFVAGDDVLPLKGEAVLLVDDVYTTGATIQECCTVLLNAGVGEIYVAALAAGIMKTPGTQSNGPSVSRPIQS